MKRTAVISAIILMLIFCRISVNAKEEAKGTVFKSQDGVIEMELSEDWVFVDSTMRYEDEFYDKWEINKESVEEFFANFDDCMLAAHKYENRVIAIARTREELFDYRGISDKQFEIMVKEVEACGRQVVQGVATEFRRTYENEQNSYVVYERDYGDGYKEIVYQTGLGDELIHIFLQGDEAFLENHNALNNWIDKISYNKPIEKFDAQAKSDEEFFSACGELFAKALIAALVIGALVQHMRKGKQNNNQ